MSKQGRRRAGGVARKIVPADAGGAVVVTSTKRRTRLTVVMIPRKDGDALDQPPVVATAHLDGPALDRLIARLTNVREGRRRVAKRELGRQLLPGAAPALRCVGAYVDFMGAACECLAGGDGCTLIGCPAAHLPSGGW